MRSGVVDRVALILVIGFLILAVVYATYFNMVNPPNQESTGNEEGDTTVVLIVNKTVDEWKKMYRKYLDIKVNEYKKHGWPIEDNLTHLYSIIDNAKPRYVLIKRYAVDPIGPGKYRDIVFELHIPLFAIQLLNMSEMLKLDDGFYDPFITTLVSVINEYIENTSNIGYTEFRKAYIILTLVHGLRYSEKGPDPVHPLLALYRGYGVCETQTYTALTLLSKAGIWSALIYVKHEKPPDHVRPAVHIEFPPWWKGKIPEPYIWKNMTFYAVEVTHTGRFFVDKVPNSWIEYVCPPNTDRVIDVSPHS